MWDIFLYTTPLVVSGLIKLFAWVTGEIRVATGKSLFLVSNPNTLEFFFFFGRSECSVSTRLQLSPFYFFLSFSLFLSDRHRATRLEDILWSYQSKRKVYATLRTTWDWSTFYYTDRFRHSHFLNRLKLVCLSWWVFFSYFQFRNRNF